MKIQETITSDSLTHETNAPIFNCLFLEPDYFGGYAYQLSQQISAILFNANLVPFMFVNEFLSVLLSCQPL